MPTCSFHCALSMCDVFGDAQLLTHALTNLRISGGPWVDFQLELVQNKNLFASEASKSTIPFTQSVPHNSEVNHHPTKLLLCILFQPSKSNFYFFDNVYKNVHESFKTVASINSNKLEVDECQSVQFAHCEIPQFFGLNFYFLMGDTDCVQCIFALNRVQCKHVSELYRLQCKNALDTSFTL